MGEFHLLLLFGENNVIVSIFDNSSWTSKLYRQLTFAPEDHQDETIEGKGQRERQGEEGAETRVCREPRKDHDGGLAYSWRRIPPHHCFRLHQFKAKGRRVRQKGHD